MDSIEFSDFQKVEIYVGKVLEADAVEGSDKLIKQRIDFGDQGERTIVSGIRPYCQPEDMVGKLLPYVLNLTPRTIMGIESQGMLLAAAPFTEEGEESAVLLVTEKDVKPGTKVI